MGPLYQQKGRDGTPGRIWWVKWYQHGRPVRVHGTDQNERTS